MRTQANDFLMNYTPKNRHFTSADEIALITETLGLKALDNAGLIETRNEVVMAYHNAMEAEIKYDENGEYAGRSEAYWKYSTAMMSVTAVIDNERYGRGMSI